MSADRWLAVIGIGIGVAGLVYGWVQSTAAAKEGSNLVAFLHGLKTADLPPKLEVQVNDMLARLDPPKTPPRAR